MIGIGFLLQFDDQVFNRLKDEIDELVKNAESTHMKEIKGLGERLFGLDQLMRDAKTVVRQQGELAQAFLNVSTLLLIQSSKISDKIYIPGSNLYKPNLYLLISESKSSE